jgi:hypothetical protein
MANTKLPSRLLDTSAIPALNITGDLTVDTTTLKVDSTNNRVGVGIASPDSQLHVHGVGTVLSSDSYFVAQIQTDRNDDGSNDDGILQFVNGSAKTVKGEIRWDESTNTFELGHGDNQGHLVIAAGGNVGIGTDSPDSKLSIYGQSSNADTGPHIQATTTDDSYPVFQQLNWYHDNISLNFDSYYDGQWRSSDAGSNFQIYKLSDKFQIRYDSGIAAGSAVPWTTGLVMNASGNVGIGTDNPDGFKTKIISAAKGLFVEAGDNGYTALGFDGDGLATKGSITSHDGKLYIGSENSSGTGSNGELKIIPGTGNVMMLDGANARVGIGTPSPHAKLAFGGSGQIWVNNDASNPFGLDTAPGELRLFTGNANQYQMKFGKMATDGTTFTSHLTIGDDGSNRGNVGIGTDSPATNLHVYGTDPVIRVSDDGTSGFATLELRQQNTTNEGFEISYNSGTGHTHLNNVYSAGDTVFATNAGSFGTTSTNVRMKITSNGHVSIPSQPHWFGSATNTSGSGLANAQTPHGSLSRNTINISTISGALRWIIPRTGVYVIAFNTIADSGTSRVDTGISINGTTISSQLNTPTTNSGYRQRSATLIVYVQENDYVQFSHGDWYNSSSNVYEEWRTISLTMVS